MRKIPLMIVMILAFSCSSSTSNKASTLHTTDISIGQSVKKLGLILISQPNGLTKIISDSSTNDNILAIAVHGFESRGYEWVEPLNKLSEIFSNTFFYRYDWNICPNVAADNLSDSLFVLLNNHSELNKLIIFGHSFGGLVVTNLAGQYDFDIPIEIHTIAAPLAGYPRIMSNCDLLYDEDGILTYSSWNSNVEHFQWRTQKEQDGAFRDLPNNPQEIYLENSNLTMLPPTMNGNRLGHNWSVTWVINNYLENFQNE